MVRRIVALLFGLLLTVVQLQQIPNLPKPENGETIGYDFAWVLILSVGLWALYYAARGKRKKRIRRRRLVPRNRDGQHIRVRVPGGQPILPGTSR